MFVFMGVRLIQMHWIGRRTRTTDLGRSLAAVTMLYQLSYT